MNITSQSERDALSVELAKLFAVEKMKANTGFTPTNFAETYLNAKNEISAIINRASDPL